MSPNTIPNAVIRAEYISLLCLLHSVPALPSRNAIDNIPVRHSGYTLPFLRERNLAGTLAFLSNLKDGPENIPAICIEEDPDSVKLNVLLAVNRVRPNDGKAVLEELKVGFERIFALLSQASDGDLISILSPYTANQRDKIVIWMLRVWFLPPSFLCARLAFSADCDLFPILENRHGKA